MKWTSKGNKTLTQYGFPSLYHELQEKILGEKRKMANLKEAAKAYEPTFKDITDFDVLELSKIDVKDDGVGTGKTGKEFTYHYFMDGKCEVRVPKTVLKQLKVQIEAKPELEKFTVSKSGTGIGTEYTVIPL